MEPAENLNLNLIRGLGAGRNLVYSANGLLYYTCVSSVICVVHFARR